jgi:hypothetical protein
MRHSRLPPITPTVTVRQRDLLARAQRAKALVEHALACRHRELSMCPNFRAALKARLDLQGDNSVPTELGKCRSRKLK